MLQSGTSLIRNNWETIGFVLNAYQRLYSKKDWGICAQNGEVSFIVVDYWRGGSPQSTVSSSGKLPSKGRGGGPSPPIFILIHKAKQCHQQMLIGWTSTETNIPLKPFHHLPPKISNIVTTKHSHSSHPCSLQSQSSSNGRGILQLPSPSHPQTAIEVMTRTVTNAYLFIS